MEFPVLDVPHGIRARRLRDGRRRPFAIVECLARMRTEGEGVAVPYFAHFRMHAGHPFRLDTRVYLRDEEPGVEDVCVAAIIGRNPGSATGTTFDRLAAISLGKDKLLPTVRNRFQQAYERAGVAIPHGAYVRVWNLFYLCNKTLSAAVKAHAGIRQPLACVTEAEWPPIVWFAWGPPATWHKQLPDRFLGREIEHPFYYDMDAERIVAAVPGPTTRVKHTQGLPGNPVEMHLASILRARARV
jgi:hypothetical protein